MIALKLSQPLYYLMMAVLIANLTQRKHVKHGNRKRLATLWIAGILLFLQVELVLIQHFELSDVFLIPSFIFVLAVAYLLRAKILVFKIKCVSCNEKMSFNKTVYWDNNLCDSCQPETEEEIKAAAEKEAKAAEIESFPENPDTVEEVDWDAWEPKETAVITYIFKDDKVLLINKKTGLGKGKVNAPGGRIEPAEMAIEAAVREVQEETGLTPLNVKAVGQLSFIFKDGYSLKGFVYFADDCTGDMKETDEADPFWQSVDQIPYDKMWEDDKLWLPLAMSGKYIKGHFIFDGDKMISQEIEESQVSNEKQLSDQE
ncbi:MAG: 8-oxo-dGTP diphosphatase [Spirochaetales bacterium]|nr:8-oxo-dGTP diphosphatase [Spirochaetales bacterium]